MYWSSHRGEAETNLLPMRTQVRSIPCLAQWVGDAVDPRLSSDPTLLWLWHRLAAVALIRPLAWVHIRCPCSPKRQTKIVIFPFYNDSIYFKIYSRKTTFYHTLEHSYQFLSGYRPEVQQVDNERFILSGVEEGTRLGILIVFNKDRQFEINVKTSFQLNLNTFSCAYFPFTDRYFCLFSK